MSVLTLPTTHIHFPMGRPFVYAPAAAFNKVSTGKLSNKSWKREKDRLYSFWRRRLKEYAPTVIKKTKRTQPEKPLVWILEEKNMKNHFKYKQMKLFLVRLQNRSKDNRQLCLKQKKNFDYSNKKTKINGHVFLLLSFLP